MNERKRPIIEAVKNGTPIPEPINQSERDLVDLAEAINESKELPKVTSADSGKVATVGNDGKWSAETPSGGGDVGVVQGVKPTFGEPMYGDDKIVPFTLPFTPSLGNLYVIDFTDLPQLSAGWDYQTDYGHDHIFVVEDLGGGDIELTNLNGNYVIGDCYEGAWGFYLELKESNGGGSEI